MRFRRPLLQYLGACLVLSQSLLGAPLAAQGSLPVRRVAAQQCMDSNDPIYLADRRFAIRGWVRGCENGVFDVTAAPYAIRPGERLMIAACRYNSQLPNAIVRARMNTPYLLNPASRADMEIVPYTSNSNYRWEQTSRALPFVPTRILDMGRQQGYRIYAYSGLRFLPSRINDAYPLSASSVILAIDGCAFSSPNALAAMLHAPGGKDYIEVSYFQENESPRVFRRAFIPMYPRAWVNAEWTQLTRAHPIFNPDRSGQIVAIAAIMSFALLVDAFARSEMGQAMAREREDCLRANRPMIIC